MIGCHVQIDPIPKFLNLCYFDTRIQVLSVSEHQRESMEMEDIDAGFGHFQKN